MNVKPSTIALNRRFVEGHVLPYLGDCKLADITVIQCQDLVNKWFNQGYKQTPYFRKITAQIIIQTPKTASSTRSISLDDETVRIMNKWCTIQRSDYLRMGFNTSYEEQFIFTNDRNELYSP